MRKKQEKERERSKLARVHAARQEETQRKQQKLSVANDFDASSLGKSSDMAPLTVKTEESLHVEGEPWESQDPLGSEDDLNAEEVLDLFPMLPSPPREIMESLKEESLFGLEDDIGFDPNSKVSNCCIVTPL
ncbi:unnamed protein product [Cylicostephanus goldi]|uniref:Uncharacterized protein n=1 Tax=Cylicostephanus goldi TaxID=71465 RepID=A0A3P6TD97_CYLGO|nr:unnamed protein product [Cylicostephanus goldi]